LGEAIYFCSDSGILASYDLASGEENYRERLGEGRTGFSASALAANGNLYCISGPAGTSWPWDWRSRPSGLDTFSLDATFS